MNQMCLHIFVCRYLKVSLLFFLRGVCVLGGGRTDSNNDDDDRQMKVYIEKDRRVPSRNIHKSG